MAKTLAAFVHVDHPQKGHMVLQPGDELPKWAEKQVTNPKAFYDEKDDDEDAPQTSTTYDNYSDDQLQNAVDERNQDGRAKSDELKLRKNASRKAVIQALVQDDANPPPMAAVAAAQAQAESDDKSGDQATDKS